MPLVLAPLPVIIGVIGMLIYATIYSLADSVLILALCAGVGAVCYFATKFLLVRLTRIDRMEVKFLAGALSVIATMIAVIRAVSDNT